MSETAKKPFTKDETARLEEMVRSYDPKSGMSLMNWVMDQIDSAFPGRNPRTIRRKVDAMTLESSPSKELHKIITELGEVRSEISGLKEKEQRLIARYKEVLIKLQEQVGA